MFLQAQGVNFEVTSLAEIRSERVHQFATWWLRMRGDRRCPSRDDFNPAEFKNLLPQFVLADISYDPFDVRFRLCGTMVASLDEDLTGRRLDELQHSTPTEIAALKRQYEAVCQTVQPIFVRGQTTSPLTMVPIGYEGGLWPLSSDGRVVDRCAGIQDMTLFPQSL